MLAVSASWYCFHRVSHTSLTYSVHAGHQLPCCHHYFQVHPELYGSVCRLYLCLIPYILPGHPGWLWALHIEGPETVVKWQPAAKSLNFMIPQNTGNTTRLHDTSWTSTALVKAFCFSALTLLMRCIGIPMRLSFRWSDTCRATRHHLIGWHHRWAPKVLDC